MSEGKSSYRQAIDALGRANKKIGEFRERGETLMTEGMRTVVVGATAFSAGLADQRFGQLDAETGIRTHKINGAPTSLVVSGLLKGASAFGLFGKAETVGFAAGDGTWGHSASSWGRQAGERLRRRAEKTIEAVKASDASKAAPSGDKAEQKRAVNS